MPKLRFFPGKFKPFEPFNSKNSPFSCDFRATFAMQGDGPYEADIRRRFACFGAISHSWIVKRQWKVNSLLSPHSADELGPGPAPSINWSIEFAAIFHTTFYKYRKGDCWHGCLPRSIQSNMAVRYAHATVLPPYHNFKRLHIAIPYFRRLS
jgi:hypothetical protein